MSSTTTSEHARKPGDDGDKGHGDILKDDTEKGGATRPSRQSQDLSEESEVSEESTKTSNGSDHAASGNDSSHQDSEGDSEGDSDSDSEGQPEFSEDESGEAGIPEFEDPMAPPVFSEENSSKYW